MDWEDFTWVPDDEGQGVYVATDPHGVQHLLDEDEAGHLLDSLSGHAAPTELSEKFEK